MARLTIKNGRNGRKNRCGRVYFWGMSRLGQWGKILKLFGLCILPIKSCLRDLKVATRGLKPTLVALKYAISDVGKRDPV